MYFKIINILIFFILVILGVNSIVLKFYHFPTTPTPIAQHLMKLHFLGENSKTKQKCNAFSKVAKLINKQIGSSIGRGSGSCAFKKDCHYCFLKSRVEFESSELVVSHLSSTAKLFIEL